MKKSKLGYWCFLLPSLLAFLIVELIPAATGLGYSLTDWNGISGDVNFVGLKNYLEVFRSDPQFWRAFGFTAVFAVCAVISVNLVGFCLALLVTSKIKGTTLMRGVFFLPNLIGGILLGFTWQFIFVQAFEALGKATGIAWLQGWLSDTATSFFGLLIVVTCLLYTSPSPRDRTRSRMPSSA